MRAVSMAVVVVASAAVGVFTTLLLGFACAHCNVVGGLVVLGLGILATVVVAAVGTRVRRRLLDSAAARRRTVALLAGAAAALTAWAAVWTVLLADEGEETVSYPSLEDAVPAAIDSGGRHRWPGTTFRVRTVEPGHVEVARRWLGLLESTVTIQEYEGTWKVYGPTSYEGWFVQVTLACALPGALAGFAVSRAAHRRLVPVGGP